MKKIIPFLFLFISTLSLPAQDHVFVLVDVSGDRNITPALRAEALELVKGLILGKVDPHEFSQWKETQFTDSTIRQIMNNAGKPLIAQNKYLTIMPFGKRETCEEYDITLIKNLPHDLDRSYQFSSAYNDNYTFHGLSKAYATSVAVGTQKISSYYLIVILGKDEEAGHIPYTKKEKEYLDNRRSAIASDNLGIIRYTQPGIDFKIHISHEDISRLIPVTGGSGGNPPPPPVDVIDLDITSPKGTRSSPFEASSDKMLVAWRCLGCPEPADFTLSVYNLDTKEKEPSIRFKGKNRASQSVVVKPGISKITLSTKGATVTTYVHQEGEGNPGFWLFLLLLGLGALILWFIRKKRSKSTPQTDPFQTKNTADSDGFENQPEDWGFTDSDSDGGHF